MATRHPSAILSISYLRALRCAKNRHVRDSHAYVIHTHTYTCRHACMRVGRYVCTCTCVRILYERLCVAQPDSRTLHALLSLSIHGGCALRMELMVLADIAPSCTCSQWVRETDMKTSVGTFLQVGVENMSTEHY